MTRRLSHSHRPGQFGRPGRTNPLGTPRLYRSSRISRSDPGSGLGGYPSYSEREVRRRARRRPTLPLSESVSGLPADVTRYLLDSALTDLLDALDLTPLERAVAEMRLGGASVREIAVSAGLKKWRVERALATVRRHWLALQHAALPAGPVRHDAGWQDVYLSETRRRGKR